MRVVGNTEQRNGGHRITHRHRSRASRRARNQPTAAQRFGGCNRQRRWRAHGNERPETGRPGLVHEFETGPTTDDHRPSRRRNLPIQHESAHHLVDGIVTTDIFSGQHDGTIGIQHAGCVHCAGRVEQFLHRSQVLGTGGQRTPLDRVALDGCEHRRQFIDVVGTAETTRGRRRCQPRGRLRGTAAGRDRDDVEGGRGRRTIRAVLHFDDWLTGKQPFVVAETDGELEVVARGSHGCRDSRAVELDR